MTHLLRGAALALILAAGVAAQSRALNGSGSLNLSLTAPSPFHFASGPGCGAGIDVCDVVLTETLALEATLTLPVVPPTFPTQARWFQLFLGAQATAPLLPPFAPPPGIFIDLGSAAFPPMILLDSSPTTGSFSDPSFLFFAGGSNVATIPLPLGINIPVPPALLPPLTFQAVAQDDPALGTAVLSNAVSFQVIDPETAGHAPALIALTPGSGGAGTPVAIRGTNLLAQSNWIQFPPAVLVEFLSQGAVVTTLPLNGLWFDEDQSTSSVQVIRGTMPSFPLIAPPFSCTARLRYVNNAFISPAATPSATWQEFTYTSLPPQLTPQITAITPPLYVPEPGSLQPMVITGDNFPEEVSVYIESDFAPGIPPVGLLLGPGQITVVPGSAPPETLILLDAPTLCSGDHRLWITGCGGFTPAPASLTYATMPPSISTVDQIFDLTTPPLVSATSPQIARLRSGDTLTLSGANFITAAGPLATATPPPPPGTFQVTRLFYEDPSGANPVAQTLIGGAGPMGIIPISATQLVGSPQVAFQTGNAALQPQLGCKVLRVQNPPCVNDLSNPAVAGAPISSDASLPGARVVVQAPTPPAITSVFPGIVAVAGGTEVEIRGSGFFRTTNPDFQDFPPGATQIDPCDPAMTPRVPLVVIGGLIAPRVRVVDETTLMVTVPPVGLPTCNVAVNLRVFNPDLQASNVLTLRYGAALTDRGAPLGSATWAELLVDTVSAPVNQVIDELDESALIAFAAQGFTWSQSVAQTNGFLPQPGIVPAPGADAAPAVVFVRNPRANPDAADDPLAPANASHEFAFLFNTRGPGGMPRSFNFAEIDLPATITLPPGQTWRPVQLPHNLSDTTPVALDSSPPASGTTLRVIVKAVGFRYTPSPMPGQPGILQLDEAGSPPEVVNNHPLVFQSRRDVTIDALVNLSGDAFLDPGDLSLNPIAVRLDRTWPSAGGGVGGRGGAWFPEGTNPLPGPNLGLGPTQLQGGHASNLQRPLPTPLPSGIAPDGGGGLGAAPLGFGGGGGGGGGYATPGQSGFAGAALGGSAGTTVGTASLYAGPATPLPIGVPADDRLIYGNDAASYLFTDPFANPMPSSGLYSGLFYGGAAGGGGGGGLAIIVPAITLGGRGGNAGGCVIFVADQMLLFGPSAVIWARGENGLPGFDAFPLPTSDPTIPINVPGAGGAGSGGTIYGLALGAVCFSYGPQTSCPITALPYPGGANALPFMDARGGTGGPGTSFVGVGQTVGGDGGDGRIRFAVNESSPHLNAANATGMPGLEEALTALFGDPSGTPNPQLVVPAPTGATSMALPPLGYFRYPCQ